MQYVLAYTVDGARPTYDVLQSLEVGCSLEFTKAPIVNGRAPVSYGFAADSVDDACEAVRQKWSKIMARDATAIFSQLKTKNGEVCEKQPF